MISIVENGSEKSPRKIVFYSVAAQWDNLGDIEIRKTALAWIQESGSDVYAYTGDMPREYLEAYGVNSGVRWVSSALRYQGLLWGHIFRSKASIVFAPGPQVFAPEWGSIGKSMVNWINVVGVRLSGGAVLGVGRSLRGHGRGARSLQNSVISVFHLFTVRDTSSAAAVGRDLVISPDLAFFRDAGDEQVKDPSASASAGRKNVLISLRGDRAVSSEGLSEMVTTLRARDLNPILITQVKRDDEQHARLARELGIPVVLWEGKTHAQQMDVVDEAYSRALFVVSNRLHALLFGLQHGAVPVAVLDSKSDKLQSTLEEWVPLTRTDGQFRLAGEIPWANFNSSSQQIALTAGRQRARDALEEVRKQFVGYLSLPAPKQGHSVVWN